MDAQDNDPVRLWARLVEAFRQALPTRELTIAHALATGVTDARFLVDTLIADLGEGSGPVIVCLDDIHTLEAGEAAGVNRPADPLSAALGPPRCHGPPRPDAQDQQAAPLR